MKFKIIGHASFQLEHQRRRLVVDPWLKGAVYNHSWWHFPEPVFNPDKVYNTDFMYITHWHFDHFHTESLNNFNKGVHIFVPKFPISSLAGSLKRLGFTQITEMVHNRPYKLADDFVITSTQISHGDDSVLDIQAGGKVLVDLNDAHPLASSWKTFNKRLPKIDFVMRSHSPAQSYPYCFEHEDPSERLPISKDEYIKAFYEAIRILNPAYAIPSASSVCHLHRENRDQNCHVVTDVDVENWIKEHPFPKTDLKIMPPGSSWSDEKGFDIKENPFRFKFDEFVAQQVEKNKGVLKAVYEEEKKSDISFDLFESYFKNFMRSLLLFRRLLNITWVFVIEGKESPYWMVDIKSGKVYQTKTLPEVYTSKIEVPLYILNEALTDWTYTNIDIGKRWSVYVKKGQLKNHFLLHTLLVIYEGGYLTKRNLIRPRTVVGLLRRYKEGLDYLKLAVRFWKKSSHSLADFIIDPEA